MNKDLLKDFWEKKAFKYPLPFEETNLFQTEKILNNIKAQGIVFFKKRVLDIGCGTGTYTLPVAKEASYVCGIDCSSAMLSILEAQAEDKQIKNVTTINHFWEEINPLELNLLKRFDIVMAIMTPAVKSERDILKMEECAKEWLIYMGWGKRKNSLMEKIFEMHGIEWNSHSPFLSVFVTLERLGRHPHFEFFEYSWEFKGKIEEALEDFCDYIRLYGKKPKKDLIVGELIRNYKSGIVEHKTEAEVGLLIWRVPSKEVL